MIRPELVVPPHALVIPLPPRSSVDETVRAWVGDMPDLWQHTSMLLELVGLLTSDRAPGDVAAFMLCRDEDGVLSGGAALLALEPVAPMSGSPSVRSRIMARELRDAARDLGHFDGVTEIEPCRTKGRVAAVRIRFISAVMDEPAAGAGPAVGAVVNEPVGVDAGLVEVSRWLYPVPHHPDLVWSLYFQTVDLDRADQLIAEFDAMAASLRWARE